MISLTSFEHLSILDKLQSQIMAASVPAEAVIEGISRDLENLLNTRNNGSLLATQENSLTCSILNYGLADFALFNLAANDDQTQFCRHIEHLLKCYEPRLQNPKVCLASQPVELTFSWHFQITADLMLADQICAVAFSSALDLVDGHYRILGALYE